MHSLTVTFQMELLHCERPLSTGDDVSNPDHNQYDGWVHLSKSYEKIKYSSVFSDYITRRFYQSIEPILLH